MLTRRKKSKLKKKLGQSVTVTLKEECTDYENSRNSTVKHTHYPTVLLGIHGVEEDPVFLLGREEDGEEAFWRCVSWTLCVEEKGIPYFRYACVVEAIDKVDVSDAFLQGRDRHDTYSSPVSHLMGYRTESVQGQLARMNWATPSKETNKKMIEAVRKLERIV